MEQEDKEQPFMKKSYVGTILKITLISFMIVIGLGTASMFIETEKSMMIGDIEVLDMDRFFETSSLQQVNIAFILIQPHPLTIEQGQDPIYLMERTNTENCYSCKKDVLPVKIVYTTTLSFEIMNKLGIIENAEIKGVQYKPVEKAEIWNLDSSEDEFVFDIRIVQEMSSYEIDVTIPESTEDSI
jgi:hypothetical protein